MKCVPTKEADNMTEDGRVFSGVAMAAFSNNSALPGRAIYSFDSQLLLDLLQRNALGLGHDEDHP
jgi:hypothetical protein